MNKNFTKKIVSLASAVAIMGAVAVPAMAASAATGTTNVFYSSENIATSDGKWGVKIPSGVALTNDKNTVSGTEYGISLVSMDPQQTDLAQLYNELEVNGTVTSQNEYKFVKFDGSDAGTKFGGYTYQVGTQALSTTEKNLPQLTLQNKEHSGTFTLTEKLVQKGQYKDMLTFSFNAAKETLK